jgi:two-component system, NarL family, sensor histidine kinase UhpB
VRRHIQADLPALKDMTELAVYRVAQEALTNVARHSDSERAELMLSNGTGQLRLTVRDHGHGLSD